MTRCLVLLLTFAASALIPATATAQTPVCAALPMNIVVPAVSQEWIQSLIARSPTLQRQCRIIASADYVTVRLSSTRVEKWCRARTSFSRDRVGRIRASIEIPVSADFAELLAHELEHVIEQIEGVNLRRLARHRDSGVWEVAPNVFETVRAIDAGTTAAIEAFACSASTGGCGVPVAVVAAKD